MHERVFKRSGAVTLPVSSRYAAVGGLICSAASVCGALFIARTGAADTFFLDANEGAWAVVIYDARGDAGTGAIRTHEADAVQGIGRTCVDAVAIEFAGSGAAVDRTFIGSADVLSLIHI